MRKADINENIISETVNNQDNDKNDESYTVNDVTDDESTTENSALITTDEPITKIDETTHDDPAREKDEGHGDTITQNDGVSTSTESTTENEESVTTNSQNNIKITTNTDVDVTTDTTTKRGPKRSKRTTTTEGPTEVPVLRSGAGKNTYKTSFFCPFYGVITMTSVY